MTVIVGIDGSHESMRALQFAVGEAKLRQNPLRVVHVFDVPVTGSCVVHPAPCPVLVVRS